jgi:hemerythrin-like domain-containing protein
MMIRIIESLREDHRNIEKLLLVLEHELDAFDRDEGPDYEIIKAIIDYFQDYPDCCHHPKEDMIFSKLKERDTIAAESVGDLDSEHRNEGKRLRRMDETIKQALTEHEVSRRISADVMRDFIEQERTHMAMEERLLFTAALRALQPDDWAAIEVRWSEMKDSIFNVAFEEKGHSLRDRILLRYGRNRKH